MLAVGVRSLSSLGPWLGTTAATWIWNLRPDDMFGGRGTLGVRGRGDKSLAHVGYEGCSGKRFSLKE